jgi:uncharacterized protein involved in exopolysaccharide biosynthesis
MIPILILGVFLGLCIGIPAGMILEDFHDFVKIRDKIK